MATPLLIYPAAICADDTFSSAEGTDMSMKRILVTTVLLLGATWSEKAPIRAQNSAAAKPHATRGDEAAKLIGKCGKPDRDFTKNEGGQAIRHIIYKKQNIELMYSRQGAPAWVLVGIFKANADENMDKEEANRRLPCAAGSIRTVLDRP
jgi:hypothetical protein